ncbi:hypothetical protein NDU88_002544 [Pleurodeles waltl]|uniref:Uncharacterized protein n=1 Tax=Pleurodeles waltl TaxID=8319 RepID=A0AAV7MN06_PLEWA|nr:hypothetical protein NDU88_002544 [Pleurodeles waltl]
MIAPLNDLYPLSDGDFAPAEDRVLTLCGLHWASVPKRGWDVADPEWLELSLLAVERIAKERTPLMALEQAACLCLGWILSGL